MKYGYARINDADQSYRVQINRLRRAGVNLCNIYHERFTAKTSCRPQFCKLLKRLQINDELVITRLDQLAISMKDALRWIKFLLKRGVKIYVIEQIGWIDQADGRLVMAIMSAVANFEHRIVTGRINAGREYAKKRRHVKFGRRSRMQRGEQVRRHYYRIYNDYRKRGATKTANDYDVSRQDVYEIIKAVDQYMSKYRR